MIRFKNISIRVSEENYEQIMKMADEEKMSASDLIRKALGLKDPIRNQKKVEFKMDTELLIELKKRARDQGCTLEELLNQMLSKD